MKISIHCLKCEEEYKVMYSNTRIKGPIICTTCPFCKTETERSFSKFVELQAGRNRFSNRFEVVTEAIRLAQEIEKELIDE